jgi:hypothetical protein
VVGNSKDDKDNQPDSRNPQAEDQQALRQSFEQCHPTISGVTMTGLRDLKDRIAAALTPALSALDRRGTSATAGV